MVRRWLSVSIAVLVAAAAISMAGDVRHLEHRLAGFAWSAFAAALALALGNYMIRFARWQLYLRWQKVRVPVRSSALVFGAGLSLSITPGKLGELVKSVLLQGLHDIPVTRTAPVVIAERVSDLAALLLLALAGVGAYGVDPWLVAIAAAALGAGLAMLAWQRPARALIDGVTRLRPLRRLRDPLHETLRELSALCRPGPLAIATAISVPAWSLECLGFALVCDAFPGAHVELGFATVIYAGTTIAGALSFLPGGLGVTEGAMTLALVRGASQLDPATAVAATLLTRVATLWFAVALGVGLLVVARRAIARRERSSAG